MKSNGTRFLSERQFSNHIKLSENGNDPLFNPSEWANISYINHLGDWIDENDLSLRILSERLNEHGFSFGYQYIQKIIAGSKKPSFEFLFAMKKTFDLSLDDIFFFESNYRLTDSVDTCDDQADL